LVLRELGTQFQGCLYHSGGLLVSNRSTAGKVATGIIGKHMDSLAQKFARNHDMKVKDEIERLAKEYGKLKDASVFRP
jgi:hypothetical protein